MANKAALLKLAALANPVLTKDYILELGGVWLEAPSSQTSLRKRTCTRACPQDWKIPMYSSLFRKLNG